MLVPPSQPACLSCALYRAPSSRASPACTLKGRRGWGNPIHPLHPASRLPLYRARARSASGIRFSSFQKKVHEIPLVRAPGKASCFHCLGRARIFGFFIIRNSSIFSRAQILPTSLYSLLLTPSLFLPFTFHLHLSAFNFLHPLIRTSNRSSKTNR
jgi:hypothetical protein